MNKIIWFLGKRLKIIRYLYWRLSGHKYLWGIIGYLDDHYEPDPEPVTAEGIKEASDWMDKYLEEIFGRED